MNVSVTRLLREACEQRGVEYLEVSPTAFAYDRAARLASGDLMYRPSSSIAAHRTEQFLHAPGVATFYAGDDDRLFFVGVAQELLFERAGIDRPATIHCASADRTLLASWAARLGGYPLLAKMGGQAGTGVVMLESFRALCSFVDFALSLKREPVLSEFIDRAVLWRAVVVGDRVVAAYTCKASPGDFRAVDPDGGFTTDPPADVAKAAIAAVRATRLELGGVDVLARDGRCYVLESNFPCYFPHAQLHAGIDVAGAMIDHLVRKAEARERAVVDR